MAPNTRRDGHGRLLAPSRVNPRAEVVIQPPAGGEQLSEARMLALGVDFNAPARGVSKPQPADAEDDSGDGEPEFPKPKGQGWYELSDGSSVRGKDEAEAAEAALHEE